MAIINGIWYPDTDGGLASYGQNRYNIGGVNYGGVDPTVSSAMIGKSPVANTNAQSYLNNFNFDDVNKTQITQDTNWVKGADDIKDLGNTTVDQSFGDKFASWFTPQGDKGTSLGGNVMGAVGSGVGALSGLAGMYYAKKNFDLQKDQQNYLKGREAASDARKGQFAANAGGGASYVYK